MYKGIRCTEGKEMTCTGAAFCKHCGARYSSSDYDTMCMCMAYVYKCKKCGTSLTSEKAVMEERLNKLIPLSIYLVNPEDTSPPSTRGWLNFQCPWTKQCINNRCFWRKRDRHEASVWCNPATGEGGWNPETTFFPEWKIQTGTNCLQVYCPEYKDEKDEYLHSNK